MWRKLVILCIGVSTASSLGCVTGRTFESIVSPGSDPSIEIENPVYLPFGAWSYAKVFDNVQDILGEYFDIRTATRHDGMIETYPRIAPGFEQFWKRGSPDMRQRLLATFQTIRHYAVVQVTAANDGGFFVSVKVYQDLEDLPKPTSATAGGASFRSDNPLERQYDVVDTARQEPNWIPIDRNGERMRDYELEQLILRRLKKCM